MKINDADRKIDLLIRANQPIISVITYEEERVIEHLLEVRSMVVEQELQGHRQSGVDESQLEDWRPLMRPLITWSCTTGFDLRYVQNPQQIKSSLPDPNFVKPEIALKEVMGSEDSKTQGDWGGIYVFRDFHPYMDPSHQQTYSSRVIRQLRDIAENFRIGSRTLILLSPIKVIPPELEKDILVVEYPLPGIEDLREKLDELRAERFGERIKLTAEQTEELLDKSVGLTLSEVRAVWIKSLAQSGELDRSILSQINEEKKQIIQKSGLLEYFPTEDTFDQVGGLLKLKKWVQERKIAFSGTNAAEPNAPKSKLPTLKGLLLVGIPGCGKSLAAKAIASELRVPLVRLDAGRLYQSYLGSTEANFRRAISVVESLAPVVLWIDEVEKGFPQISSAGDSGTSSRVLGSLLNWMQEKTRQVFVVTTANDVERMPLELTRKGRFDEIFYVGLPSKKETGEIISIHMRKWEFPLDADLIDRLAGLAHSRSLTGAEIEMAVKNALWARANLLSNTSLPDVEAVLVEEIRSIRPIVLRLEENKSYKKMQETFDRIAVPASESGNQQIPMPPPAGPILPTILPRPASN